MTRATLLLAGVIWLLSSCGSDDTATGDATAVPASTVGGVGNGSLAPSGTSTPSGISATTSATQTVTTTHAPATGTTTAGSTPPAGTGTQGGPVVTSVGTSAAGTGVSATTAGGTLVATTIFVTTLPSTIPPTTTIPATAPPSTEGAPVCDFPLVIAQTETAFEGITPTELHCADVWAAWSGVPEDPLTSDGYFAVAQWNGVAWQLRNLGTVRDLPGVSVPGADPSGVCTGANIPADLWPALHCVE
jgi:hypothetical protein